MTAGFSLPVPIVGNPYLAETQAAFLADELQVNSAVAARMARASPSELVCILGTLELLILDGSCLKSYAEGKLRDERRLLGLQDWVVKQKLRSST